MTSSKRTLALLGGGPEQCVAVEIAHELGFGALVVDDDPTAPAARVADRFLQSCIQDPSRLLRDLADETFHGVFTHAAELGIEQARVAEAFALPALSVASAERGTLKHLRIRAFEEAGIRVPRHRELEHDADASRWRAAAEELGYPVVAKPINEKGARGVELVRDADELERYRAQRLASSPRFLLESFERGQQLSTESVFLDGEAHWHAIALRHYDGMERFHPYLIEDGHSMHCDLAPEVRAEVERVIARCARALEVTDGVLKGDLLIDADSTPVVLEMAIRTSGGRFADLVTPLASGVNILYPLIQLAMGEPVEPAGLAPRWTRGVSQRFLFLPEGTRVSEVPDPAPWLARDEVAEVVFSRRFLEEREQRAIRSHHDRIGYVVCTGADREEADMRALSLARELEAQLR